MASKIIALNWKENNIAQRESDGYVNLTQMCKANGKRLYKYLKSNRAKEYIAELELKVNYPQLGVVNNTATVSVLETTEGRKGGTWGHPLLALELARWISPEFAVWCDSHIFVLMEKGETSLDIDPFTVTQSIIEEKRVEYNQLAEINDRFLEITDYSHWSR